MEKLELLTKIPLTIANADMEIFERSPNRDQSTLLAIGWAIVIACVSAGTAFFFFIYFLTNSILPSTLFGLIMVVIVYLLDRTLLRDENRARLAVRFGISLIIAIIISLPIKVKIEESMLISSIKRDVHLYNQNLVEDNVGVVKVSLDEKLEEVNDCITESSQMNRNRKVAQLQRLLECRRIKEELLKNWDDKLAEARASIEDKFITNPDTSFVAQLGEFVNVTMNPSKTQGGWLAWFLNLAIFLAFMITEALPSVLRATLQDSFYITEIAHKNEAVNKAQAKKFAADKDLFDKDNYENSELRILKRKYWEEMGKQMNSDFTNSNLLQDLGKQIQYLEELEAAKKEILAEDNNTPSPPPTKKVIEKEEIPSFEYDDNENHVS